jgi:hypothetical protein
MTVRHDRGVVRTPSLRVSDVSPSVSRSSDSALTQVLTRPTRQEPSIGANWGEVHNGEYLPFATAYAPTPVSPIVEGPVTRALFSFRKLDRIAPLVPTTALLVLGRAWHAHGAADSIGDALLPGLAAAVATVVGAAAKSANLASVALSVAGGLAAAAIAGYAHEIWEPLVAWGIGTSVSYGVSWRGWREEVRTQAAGEREERLAAMGHLANLQEASINARRDIAVTGIKAAADVQVAQIIANSNVAMASRYGEVRVDSVDEALLELRPEAARALAPVTVDPASSLLDWVGEKVEETR